MTRHHSGLITITSGSYYRKQRLTRDKFAKSSVFTSILPLLENMRCCYCIVSSRFCLGMLDGIFDDIQMIKSKAHFGMKLLRVPCYNYNDNWYDFLFNGMCFKISALKCH
ncbi:hypothetical protein T06_9619 [Trichinella sp. T6]|nr:hypothetical protein T06_9619 [Trichinella sp. T6]